MRIIELKYLPTEAVPIRRTRIMFKSLNVSGTSGVSSSRLHVNLDPAHRWQFCNFLFVHKQHFILSREGGQTVSCFNALMNTSHSPTRSSLSRRRGSDCILLQCSYEYQPLSYKAILVKRRGSDCILLQCSYEHQPLSYKVILVKKKGVRLYLASMLL